MSTVVETGAGLGISPLTGRPAPKEMLVDVARLEREYFECQPDLSDPNQMVSFGTSGHRGSPLHGTFTEVHILAITPQPSPYGIVDVGPAALVWVGRLHDAGQSWWQALPLGPTGYGNSPDQSLSSFAGNGLLISPDWLVEHGLLRASDCECNSSCTGVIDYDSIIPFKHRLLERAWRNFSAGARPDLRPAYEQFRSDEAHWLEDYALFRTLITPNVRTLRDRFHLPGTRVLQFAFDGLADNSQVSKRRRTKMGVTATVPAAGWRLSEPGTAETSTNMLRPAVSSGVNHELYVKTEMRSEVDFEGIVGQSSALRQALQLVEMVATSDSTVLLLGETGTGKELIARAIHHRSLRRDRALVKLNCAAIPSGLLESELFGHERGAFTGAITQKVGRLELADQGTLFLDEVGDIPLELQPKLLRVLQEREFERLGSTRTIKVDVRLVAATHRDLEAMMAEDQFRSDLYYRLNVFPIRIPPLRERREDIPALVRYFTGKYARRMGKRINTIPARALRKLMRWHWPGNVRELENIVERAVILTRGDTLEIAAPPWRSSAASGAPAKDGSPDEQETMVRILRSLLERAAMSTPDNVQPVAAPELTKNGASAAPATAGNCDEQQTIVRILRETNGRVGGANGAAARLGLKRTTLIARMKKLGIHARQALDAHRYSEVEVCP